jgi:hypothetical protein
MKFSRIPGLCLITTIAAMLVIVTGCNGSGGETGVEVDEPVSPGSPANVVVRINWSHGAAMGTPEYERISGYYIYYGRNSGNLTNRYNAGMQTSAELQGSDFGYTGRGTYYFQVVSYGTGGITSVPSPQQSINIQ